MPYDPPLSGVRILDLTTGPMAEVGRLLADLGATVTVVSLAGVTGTDDAGPSIESVSIGTAVNRRGLKLVDVDTSTPAGQQQWAALLAEADILIENTPPLSAAERMLAVNDVHHRYPALVILSISDFGRDSRFRTWQGTTPVFHALSSELSRSGIPGEAPLVPPGDDLPYQVGSAQAAVFVLSVLLDRMRTGVGEIIDFAILEGAMQVMDPPFGMAGSASAGVPISKQQRNWAAERMRYPILKCADGYIRICILAKRQWRGMFEWMGKPEEFADPRYDDLLERYRSRPLSAAIAGFCSDKTRAELEVEGQRHGVPAAAVLSVAEAIRSEQIAAREFFREAALAPGLVAPVPAGVTEIDGHRASALETPTTSAIRPESAPILAARPRREHGLPLEGVRVLDLGVIVVGGDTGRVLADLGAEVIKVENSAFRDGMRIDLRQMTHAYGAGNRNKRSIGIDLRRDEGRILARRLIEWCDIVLTNFKPGVAQTLGLDYESVRDINPGAVVVDSSAFGPTGPWAKRMGYGPLVRAASGFTKLWVYPDKPDVFCDTVTVYPDHVAARIGVMCALALLVRRERTGAGGSASVSQSEVMLSHLAAQIAGDFLIAQGHRDTGGPAHDAPWGQFPAAGDDNWLTITVRNDIDWAGLCRVLDRPDLLADGELSTREGRDLQRTRIDEAVSAWTSERESRDAMERLQAAGVPAGAVLRASEVPEWEYYVERRDFRDELHPYAPSPFVMENVQIHATRVADPPLGQAPMLGEQTREIATELLGLSADQTETLIADGILETMDLAESVVR